MNTTLLEHLASERLQLLLACLSTPSALRECLTRTAEVGAVREALASGALTEKVVREFVAGLLADLKPGESFAHDSTLSALAVALEPLPLPFAEEYLQDLARLQLAEMGTSIRLARECLKHRLRHPERTKEVVSAQGSRSSVVSSVKDGKEGDPILDANGHQKRGQ